MKKMSPLAAVAGIAASLMSVAPAHAFELKLSGYGTVAAAVSDDDDLQFHRNLLTSKGVSKGIDLGNDSRFGAQAVAKFNDQLSFTGQLVAQRRIDGTTNADIGADKDLDPRVEWLYMQYNVLPVLNLRLGRIATPAFLLSDSLNVGYAAPWLRAPVHIYASQVLATMDGLQANWSDTFSGFNLNTQVSYGKAEAKAVLSGNMRTLNSPDTVAVNFSVERGNVLARVGMVRLATDGVFGKIKDRYTSAGLQYDDGNVVVMAEVAQREQNSFVQLGNRPLIDGKYGYLAAGYRFGPFLPMFLYSIEKSKRVIPGQGELAGTSKAPGVSLRYDVAPNVALKAQIDQYQANDATAFVRPAADDHKVRIFTVGADFVF